MASAKKKCKKDEKVRIIHHFLDGTESDTLEGHEIPPEIQIEILKIILEGKARRAKAASTK